MRRVATGLASGRRGSTGHSLASTIRSWKPEVHRYDPAAEIEATLESLQVLLADPDPTRRLDLYTDDALLLQCRSLAVRGMPAILAREDVSVLQDVATRSELIDGDGGLASAFGSDSFTFEDPSGDRASVATYFLLTLRKETGGKWLVAREFLIEDADTN
jgi:ketosteroid isomerase-like protein